MQTLPVKYPWTKATHKCPHSRFFLYFEKVITQTSSWKMRMCQQPVWCHSWCSLFFGLFESTNTIFTNLFYSIKDSKMASTRKHECEFTKHILYSKKFSSAKNFVKSDHQAVRQEFIFVKRRIARFVFGRSVRLLIVYLHIHDYFWSHNCCFVENLVRNLRQDPPLIWVFGHFWLFCT